MREPSANEALSAWLDGELDEAGVSELEAELARDPLLRAELEALEGVVRLLRDEGPVAAPDGFEARLMARIEREEPEQAEPWWAWLRRPFGVPIEGWALALAAAAALLLFLPVWRAAPQILPGDGEAEREVSPAAVEPPSIAAVPDDPVSAKELQGQQGPQGQQEPAPAPRVGSEPVDRKRVARVGTGRGTSSEPSGVPAPSPTLALPEPAQPESPEAAAGPGIGGAEGIGGTGTGTGTSDPTAGPYRYVVRGASDGLKRDVLKICGRYGWSCTQSDGAPPIDAKMRSSIEVLVIALPTPDLTRLDQELAALGHHIEHFGGEQLARDTVRVEVVLQVVGGGGDSDVGTPNAARAREEDALEADDLP